jgi:hypothetical protein
MSLRLDQKTTPEGTCVKASSLGGFWISTPEPHVTSVCISPEDMAECIVYFLVNTDLRPGDPRLALVERLQRMEVIQGYNGEKTRRLEVMGVLGDLPKIVREAIRLEREEIDELLATRLDECFCVEKPVGDKPWSPCDCCMEVARIRGVFKARTEKP